MDGKKIYDELINILLKKASGFYYTEEQEDYEKTQNKTKNNENQFRNISFFDFSDTVKNNSANLNDTINTQNENKSETQDLVLVKKKITKHYIPPDMLAVKILFETLKEKVNEDDLNNLSDDELIKLKDKLLGELIYEDKNYQWEYKMRQHIMFSKCHLWTNNQQL